MSKRIYFSRFISIIKCLKRAPATFEDIKFYLGNDSGWLGEDYEFSKRTFQRDVNEIRTLFEIDIQYDFRKKTYFIAEIGKEYISERLLEAMDTIQALKISDRFSRHIFLEKRRPQGTEHLAILLHAIQNARVFTFSYEKFWEDEITGRVVEPYAVKESRGRWYLVAKDTKDNIVKTFGLDRMKEPEAKKERFKAGQAPDIEKLFRYSFGIINDLEAKPENMVLSFTPEQGKYVKTYPLHESQKMIRDDENEYRISLHLLPTHDFMMELLSFGDVMEVLEPQSLRHAIKGKLELSLAQYS